MLGGALGIEHNGWDTVIVFELQCSLLHRFEGWFASPEEFDRQSAAGGVECPVCADPVVRRVPSARIKRPSSKQAAPEQAPAATPAPAQHRSQRPAPPQQMTLAAFIDHVLVNSEDVGPRFAAEARKIHQGEVPHRSIRGQCSAEETEALLEEGVPVIPLPIPPKDSWQ
jgi:hypothetical protein